MKNLIIILVLIFTNQIIIAQGKFFGGNGTGYSTSEILNQTLPLSDINLIVKINNNKIHLSWDQDNIQNIQLYAITKSLNNKDYYTIGNINPRSDKHENYNFEDKDPIFGNNYYIIKQIDNNGTIVKSKVASIIFDNPQNNFQISPNPFSSKINIHTSQNIVHEKIIILTLEGKLLYELSTNNNTIDLSVLERGTYFILINGEASKIIKL